MTGCGSETGADEERCRNGTGNHPNKAVMASNIEDYALIGDCETSALVGRARLSPPVGAVTAASPAGA